MNKVNRWLQNYLVFSLPFVVACAAWGSIQSDREILVNGSFLTKATWEVLSWNLMIWFLCLITFLILMVFIPSTRDMVTRRIANIKERDEREIYITGQASRRVFTSTLSILIFLFFISIFTFNVSRIPPEEIFNNRAKSLSIGFNFKLTDDPKVEKDQTGQVLVESKDIPLSKSAILLLLIVWQISMFGLSARKIAKEE
ncbi:MAG: hypothetical protein A2Z20_04785 [Bdellovibrionales bacterium RBG_16_40_8]|nr:MAG: hypothetical protein A2Z20_04785 [Bdellovibrionales bacterium RBG_16_40_8]